MIILEFNEEQQLFHYNPIINNIPEREENTFGWKTLLYCIDQEESNLFSDFLFVQFFQRNITITFDEIYYTTNNLVNFCLSCTRKMPQ